MNMDGVYFSFPFPGRYWKSGSLQHNFSWQDRQYKSKNKSYFDASDKTSGIDHYEVKVDNGEYANWLDDGTHVYEIQNNIPGRHTLYAKAVDKAGNYLENSIEFNIDSINPPTITEYSKELDTTKH